MQTYFYVNEAGFIIDTATSLDGVRYAIEQRATYKEVQLIDVNTGEIFEQYVAWNSKAEIENALKETYFH